MNKKITYKTLIDILKKIKDITPKTYYMIYEGKVIKGKLK